MNASVAESSVERTAHFRRIGTEEIAASDNYRGIPIFAMRGLHAHTADTMRKHGIMVPGTSALEIGCGAGAMTQRLADEGLSVLGLDGVPENFRAVGPNVRNRFADLNKPFEQGYERQFDLVVAIEVIEHMESPRAFLRSCFACLKPGGQFFLTTPNVDSSHAIAALALTGKFTRFDDTYLKNDGHIMPILRHQFLAAATDCGFILKGEDSYQRDGARLFAWPRFWLLLRVLQWLRGEAGREGAISEYILRRPLGSGVPGAVESAAQE